ncbi:hypothetical protein PCANB_001731 [Pneumocystis canis]|nr:hypothetical protein PCANB_001731 [Pneumocystis canis]
MKKKDNKTIIKDLEMFNKVKCSSKGYLEVEGMEKTYKISQLQIKEKLDLLSYQKGFDLKLCTFGPYTFDYTRNGNFILIAGKKGHIGTFDWRIGKLNTEFHLRESVRNAKWLHNEKLFVVAQKKYVYMYDNTGLEVHCLKNHVDVYSMEFLPYHFLLATIGGSGYLKYQDISTGVIISEYYTKFGLAKVMAQNPYNAIIHIGHTNGVVTLWSPNLSTPLVKMLAHRGPVYALAIDREGRYMISSGADSQVKIWDIRNWKEIHSYFSPTPASTLHISDTGMLAVGWGPHVGIWKDALQKKQNSPYMTHLIPGSIVKHVKFCPYEDILGLGHAQGFSNLIIPGSGEPCYDAYEVNPYETKKQRREKEVISLLEKLQPEMIALDPNYIGNVNRENPQINRKETSELKLPEEKWVPKPKTRGKNSLFRKYLRKRAKNVMDERKLRVKTALEKEKRLRQTYLKKRLGLLKEKPLGPALERKTASFLGLSQDRENSSFSSVSSTSSLSCLLPSKSNYSIVFSSINKEITRIPDIEAKTGRQRASSASSAASKSIFKGSLFGKETGTSKHKISNIPSTTNFAADALIPIHQNTINPSNLVSSETFPTSSEHSTCKNHFFKSSKKETNFSSTSDHACLKSFFSHTNLHALRYTLSSSVSNMLHPLQKSFSSFDIKHIGSKDISLNHIIEDVWPLFCMKVFPLFNGEGLRVPVEYLNKLVRLHVKKRHSDKKMDLFMEELLKFIEAGMKSLDVDLSFLSDEKLIHRLVELWNFFFADILPYIEAIFLPLQTEFDSLELIINNHKEDTQENMFDIDIRRIALIRFRDDIILIFYERLIDIFSKKPLNLDLNQTLKDTASKLLQSILILASIHSSDEKQKKMDNLSKTLCHNWFKSERINKNRQDFVFI